MRNIIAVVDDSAEVRELIAKPIKRFVKKKSLDWKVKLYEPLNGVQEYSHWIVKNKIVLLIIDERLKDQVLSNKKNSNHLGHEAVKLIKTTDVEFPVFIITNAQDYDIDGQVISRTDFSKRPDYYLENLIGEALTYQEEFEKRSSRLSELAALKASSNLDDNQNAEFQFLRNLLMKPMIPYIHGERSDWIEEFRKQLTDLEALTKEVEEYLKGK